LLGRSLVVCQISVSLILLVGAGLLVRTLLNLQHADPGFNTDRLLLFRMQPELQGYNNERLLQLYPQLAGRLEAVPGVKAVTFSVIPLLAKWSNRNSVYLRNAWNGPRNPEGGIEPSGYACVNHVRENFLEVMEIPLLAGRTLQAKDDARAPHVAVVNQAFATHFFPNQDPIGKRFAFESSQPDSVEIIGLTGNAKYARLQDDVPPTAYLPWRKDVSGAMTFELRTGGDPARLMASVREAVRAVDKRLPVTDMKTQLEQAYETFRMERLLAKVLTVFSALAQLLASVGLFGVMAYAVSRRTREIGIRTALGATQSDIVGMILCQGLKLTGAGILLGLIGSLLFSRCIQSRLFGISPFDPVTFVTVSALLAAVSFLACWLPARRAAQVDPTAALRQD
jgi:predicted permease